MNPEEYYIGENERAYVSPTISRDEQFEFIDTLRDQVGKNNALISTQTEQLGTDIQPSLGGLTGSEGYFQQRYQTTPVETQVNTLKATAQAKALNDLMTNYSEQAKNRYQQAYRAAQKRANTGGTGGGDDEETPFDLTTTEEGEKVDVSEVDPTLIAPQTTDKGAISGANAMSDITGQGNLPTSTRTPYYYDLNGKRTGFWVNKTATGTGVETPMQSFVDKQTSRAFLEDIIKKGGRIYNQYGKDITGLAFLQMGLY